MKRSKHIKNILLKRLDESEQFLELWESTYKERYSKHHDSKKARISADARVSAEVLKSFIKLDRKGSLNV